MTKTKEALEKENDDLTRELAETRARHEAELAAKDAELHRMEGQELALRRMLDGYLVQDLANTKAQKQNLEQMMRAGG